MVAHSIQSAIRASASALALSSLLALAAGCSDSGAESSQAGLAVSSDTGVAVTFQLLEGTANVAYEGGKSLRVGVRLSHAPTNDVLVRLAPSLPGEAQVVPATIRITPSQWDTATPVEVSAVDDKAEDGIVPFALEAAVLASADERFAGALPSRYRLYTVDNDRAGVVVTPVTNARTAESGGAAGFDVRLAAPPAADVRVALSSSNEKEGTVFPTSLAFTKSNWSEAQRILVKGADDGVVDGDVSYTLDLAVASEDLEYASLRPEPITLVNEDDDVQGPVVQASPGGLVVYERAAGSESEFFVRLRAQPTRPILVSTSVDAGAPVRLQPEVLGFAPETWNVPQRVRAVAKGSGAGGAETPFTVQLSLVSEAGDGAQVVGTMRGTAAP